MATKTIYKVKGPEAATFAVQDVSGTAQLRIDGTNVTSTAAELNILDGVTATAAELNAVADQSGRIVNVTDDVTLTQATHGDRIVTVDDAAGAAITLPDASGSGAKFQILITTTISSNTTTIKVPNADNVMTGTALNAADGGDTAVMFETAADTDTITLDGSTTGGIKGDSIELIDVAADLWWVRVVGSATGTEATPFSATVS